jgi:hypothetical protein
MSRIQLWAMSGANLTDAFSDFIIIITGETALFDP